MKFFFINFINNLKPNFKYYFLVICGFCCVSWYFYIAFIRERLPRDIPFILTEFRFYILLGVCCIYIIAIKRYIFPKALNPLFIPLIQALGSPFAYFDNFLKNNKYVFPYYLRSFRYITFRMENYITYKDRKNYILRFYYLPRLFLLLIFIIDVFYFQQIKFFYFFIILNLSPFIYNYAFKYYLQVMYNQFKKHLENKYEDVYVYVANWFIVRSDDEELDYTLDYNKPKPKHHETVMKIEDYIHMRYEVKYNKQTKDLEYIGEGLAKEEILLEYERKHNKTDLTSEDYEIIKEEYNLIMPKLLELYYFLALNKETLESAYFKKFNLILLMGYLCCWSFILLKSFHTLQDFSLTMEYIELLVKNLKAENPFE